jgi:HK97 family phage portal protein
MSFIDRLAKKMLKTPREVYQATIRPSDVAMAGRYNQRPYQDLVRRYFSTWVYVAANRTASGVASMPLCVGRVTKGGTAKKSLYRGREVGRKDRDWYAGNSGRYARKAMAETDSVEEITDPTHPIVALLNSWNIRDNGYDGMERAVLHLELTGNAYLAMIGGRAVKWPVELWPLAPQFVRALPDRDTFISGYIYGRGSEIEKQYRTQDVCHLRYPNPTGDEIYGLGTLASCVMQADLSSAFTAHGLATIENGVQPGLLVSMPGTNAKQREEARVELERTFRGPAQAGRSMILGGPAEMDIKPWTIGEKEVAYLESQKDARDAIAAAFGIPTSMLTMEDAALATAEAAIPHWRMVSLIPRSRRIEDKLNETLLEVFRVAMNDPSLFVYFDTTEKENSDKVSARMVAEYAAGLRTLNEARGPLDLMKVPEGDDFKAEPVPPGMAGEDAGDGEDATDDPDAEAGAEESDPPDKEAKTLVVYETVTKSATVTKATDLLMGHHAGLCRCGDCTLHTKDDRTAKEKQTLEERLLAVFNRFSGTIIERVRASQAMFGGTAGPAAALQVSAPASVGAAAPSLVVAAPSAVSAGASAALRDTLEKTLVQGGFQDQLIDAALPNIREMFTRGYSAGNAKIGKRPSLGAFAVENPDAVQFMQGEANRLASSVTRTYSQAVADTVAKGIADGLSIPQIADDLQATMPELNDYRATMIARTETARAYTNGNVAAWEKSGDVAGKEWLLAVDACEFCKAIAAKFNTNVGLTDNFLPKGVLLQGVDGGLMSIDYTEIFAPPLHPNCRCDVAPIMRKINT